MVGTWECDAVYLYFEIFKIGELTGDFYQGREAIATARFIARYYQLYVPS
jgi:hypothetical protein